MDEIVEGALNPYQSPRGLDRSTFIERALVFLRCLMHALKWAWLLVLVLCLAALWPLVFLAALKDERPALCDWMLLLAWGLAAATWLPLLVVIVSR